MKPIVLIVTTECWVPTARLALALGTAGCTVDAVCPTRHPLYETSAARSVHRYRGLNPLRSIGNAIASSKPDVVIPGDDLAARHLHDLYRLRKRYSADEKTLCLLIERSLGSPASFDVMQARTAFMNLASEEGIRVPHTEVMANSDDLANWAARFGFPMVLKANGTSGGDGVRIVHTLDEAERALRKLQAPPLLARAIKRAVVDQDRTLVWPSLSRRRFAVNAQTYVKGHEATSTVACWRGDVLASLHFEVLSKCKAAGHATVVRSIEHGEMSKAVAKLVKRLQLSGLCGFDFMLEAKTGNAHLIEMNPRATQVGHLTLGPGRDLPAAICAAISGKPIQLAPAVTDNDTIALFPQEWARDPESEFLRSGYHDIPRDEPGLVDACIRRSRKQNGRPVRHDAVDKLVTRSRAVAQPEEGNAVPADCSTD